MSRFGNQPTRRKYEERLQAKLFPPAPTTSDRIWFNSVISAAPDFFAEPTMHSEWYKLRKGKAIYPVDPERLTHQKATLIRKYGKPHKSIWINRVDLFLITLEGDWGERMFTCNLAGINRRSHLAAQKLTKERTPDGATVEGQTYWELVGVLVADLVITLDADIAFCSPLLHQLATGELEPLTPLTADDPLFTRENVYQKTTKAMGDGDRRWMHKQSRLKEHESIVDLHLDKYGFIES